MSDPQRLPDPPASAGRFGDVGDDRPLQRVQLLVGWPSSVGASRRPAELGPA